MLQKSLGEDIRYANKMKGQAIVFVRQELSTFEVTLHRNPREMIHDRFPVYYSSAIKAILIQLNKAYLTDGTLLSTVVLIMCCNQSMSHRSGYSCIHKALRQKLILMHEVFDTGYHYAQWYHQSY